jgi:pyruvate/2-oxoglutarate dehydrogenase complex dihydrolipoamide dehydrogenase (E3) component
MSTSTEPVHADVLVIGFGKGGKTLAATMGRQGKRVVMVEQSSQMYGGTCINIGCVPTKALVHRADTRRDADEPQAWYQQAIGAVEQLTTLLRGKNFQMLDTIDTVTVVTGRARFLDPTTVEVAAGSDRLTISAETIVINTGAEPVIPDIPGLRASEHLVISTDLLHTSTLPNRLVVLGGGYLGLEFAAMYQQYGSEVTILEATPALMAREDDDIAAAVTGILADDGITVVTDARCTGVHDNSDNTVTITYEQDGLQHTLQADTVLAAVGRTPATRGLGLESAGVRTTDRGAVEVDERLRTSRPHIYALGDVNGGPQFTYVSLDDSRIVTDQLIGTGTRTVKDRVAVPQTVFITPPLSTVGLTEKQARDYGHRVAIASKPIAQIAGMPRARIVGDTRGLMKFVIDADTDQILGAALLCVDSQELVNTVALAIRHQVTASELRDAIYTHPSATEGFNEVLATIVAP